MKYYKPSQYLSIHDNNIVYNFDDIIRFIFSAYFSTKEMALTFCSIEKLSCKTIGKDSLSFSEEQMEKQKKGMVREILGNVEDLMESLLYYITSLMKLTIECREHLGGKTSDYIDYFIENKFDSLDLYSYLTDYFQYYSELLINGTLRTRNDNIKSLRRTRTGYHIDHNIAAPCLTDLILSTFFSTIHKPTIHVALPPFLKFIICEHISFLFAELHYISEDLSHIESDIKNSRSYEEKIKVGCRYNQVSAEVIAEIDRYYDSILQNHKDANEDFFFRIQTYRDLFKDYMENYHQKRFNLEKTAKALMARPDNSPTYENIIMSIHHFGRSMESLPSLYQNKKENELRDVFLAHLDNYFNGVSATGESIFSNGRTDILLKDASVNSVIFVAECKIWKGRKYFMKGLSQLINKYVTWSVSNAAIIIFVPRKNLSTVIEKALIFIKEHTCYQCYLGDRFETSFSYVFHLPNNPNRTIRIELMLFHFPRNPDAYK